MLRYKNSLLERILLEKGNEVNFERVSSWTFTNRLLGIDVQAELRAKTGSPHLGPTHMPQNMAQAPTVQRAIMNRHHQARRSQSSIAPKLEPGAPLQSPQSRPTPSSHASSPTAISPGFHNPGVMTPPGSDSQMQFHQQQQHQQHQQQRLQAAQAAKQPINQGNQGLPGHGRLLGNQGVGASLAPKGPGSSGTSTGGTLAPAAYFASPNFQNHYEQLGKLSRPLLSLSFYRAMFVLD